MPRLSALAATGAQAQGNYPQRPITMIVPFAAGGPTDVIARIVGDHMSRTLGQQIVVENVAGAGGTTGITRAAQSQPDGYTIMMGHMGTHGAAPALYPNLKYDPTKDFAPIGLAAGTPIVIVAKKDFPANDLKGFIDYMKANGDKVNMAHAGVGSVSHITGMLLQLDHQGQADPGRLSRHRPGAQRPDGQHGRLHDRPDRQRRAADPGRQHQGVRDRDAGALAGPAQRADHEGGRAAGLRGQRLERGLRAEGHAARRS